MTDPTIVCPRCKAEIKLTESLAAPLLETTRQQYQELLDRKDAEVAKREVALRERQAAVEKAKLSIDEQVATQLDTERARIAAEESQRAKLLLGKDLETKAQEVAELNEILKQRDVKLAEAQKAQAELIRKERALDDAMREMELTVEKRVQDSLAAARERAKKEAEDELKLKVSERDQMIGSLQKQIEELKRKAEQASQQLQGEVQELDLEKMLSVKFPHDVIEPVPKGEHGGDVIHRVVGLGGMQCGTILWESKRTKNWSDGWLGKLRDDQRTAKADIAIIVSQTVPKGLTTFDLIDGVWVVEPGCVVPVAMALRHSLVELAMARQVGDGQQSKMDLMYQYLTGPRFRQRIEAIVEKFSDMREDLDRERKQMVRLWAKREEQLRCVLESTAGMYGDLQGIAGKSIKEIDALEVAVLVGPEISSEEEA